MRLVRAGNNFSGYVSGDGTNWTRVESATIPMAPGIYMGLALTAHNNTRLNSTLFDSVSVSQ